MASDTVGQRNNDEEFNPRVAYAKLAGCRAIPSNLLMQPMAHLSGSTDLTIRDSTSTGIYAILPVDQGLSPIHRSLWSKEGWPSVASSPLGTRLVRCWSTIIS